jgi:hypothetical protein
LQPNRHSLAALDPSHLRLPRGFFSFSHAMQHVPYASMIRRHVGPEYWLIAQHDHALISGELAEQLGNGHFTPPSSCSAILGTALHDCGWVLHDDEPTLNGDRVPLDVFETPREIGLRVWEESAQRAATQDDYAGLLVSIHCLWLSIFASEQAPISGSRWDLSDPRSRFELNRFQHNLIELQEALRQRLGLHTDRPLKHGLADDSQDPKEQKLVCDFRWLQAMDRLSLAICCTVPPFGSMEPVLPRVGGKPCAIQLARPKDDLVIVKPWPFHGDTVAVAVPFRRIPAHTFASDHEFRESYRAAAVENFTVTLRANTI